MPRLGQVGATEVALGEHDPFGLQQAEVLVGEIVAIKLPVDPVRRGGQLAKLCSAYSLTAIRASVADRRSLASTVITGMCGGKVSASRTSATG